MEEPSIAGTPVPPSTQGRSWDPGLALGWGLLAATLLFVISWVAAGIVTAGEQPAPIENTLYLATRWVDPYIVLLPVAALGLAWWAARRSLDGPAGAASKPDAEGETGAAGTRRNLVRSRGLAWGAAVNLAILAAAAIGDIVGILLVARDQADALGSQVAVAVSEILGGAVGALLICVLGIAAAAHLSRRVAGRLAAEAAAGAVGEDEDAAGEEPETGSERGSEVVLAREWGTGDQ